jgi:hypothetical protein
MQKRKASTSTTSTKQQSDKTSLLLGLANFALNLARLVVDLVI